MDELLLTDQYREDLILDRLTRLSRQARERQRENQRKAALAGWKVRRAERWKSDPLMNGLT